MASFGYKPSEDLSFCFLLDVDSSALKYLSLLFTQVDIVFFGTQYVIATFSFEMPFLISPRTFFRTKFSFVVVEILQMAVFLQKKTRSKAHKKSNLVDFYQLYFLQKFKTVNGMRSRDHKNGSAKRNV